MVEIIALVLLPLAVLMVACKWRTLGWGWTLLAAVFPWACQCQQHSSTTSHPATLPTDSTVVFIWRNSQIAMKQASYIDDRRWAALAVHCSNCGALMCPPGHCACHQPPKIQQPQLLSPVSPRLPRIAPSHRGPLLLAGMVVSSLTAIFLVSCVDLVSLVSWMVLLEPKTPKGRHGCWPT